MKLVERYVRSIRRQYTCFHCRKTFKRSVRHVPVTTLRLDALNQPREYVVYWLEFTATCPQCGGVMYLMSPKFKSPPQSKVKEWAYWEIEVQRWYTQRMQQIFKGFDQVDPYFAKRRPK